MKRKSIWVILAILALILPMSMASAARSVGNQLGDDWVVEQGEQIDGFYYNLKSFTIPPGVTPLMKSAGNEGHGVFIQADKITIAGTLDATGMGMAGGAGGPTCMSAGRQGNVDPSIATAYFNTTNLLNYYNTPGNQLYGRGGAPGTFSANNSHLCEPGYMIDTICIPGGWLGCWIKWEVHWCSPWRPPCEWSILGWEVGHLLWKCRTDGYMCGRGGYGGGSGSAYGTPGCYGPWGENGAGDKDNKCLRGTGGGSGVPGKSLPKILNPPSGSVTSEVMTALDKIESTMITDVFFGAGGAGAGGGGAGGDSSHSLLNCTGGGAGGKGGGRIVLEAFDTFEMTESGKILANGTKGDLGGTGGGLADDKTSCDCKTTSYFYQGGKGGDGGGGSGGGVAISAPIVRIKSPASSIQVNGGPSATSTASVEDYSQNYALVNSILSPIGRGSGAGGSGAAKIFPLPALSGGVMEPATLGDMKMKIQQKGCDYKNVTPPAPETITEIRDDMLKKVEFQVVTSSGAIVSDVIPTTVAGRTFNTNNYFLPMLPGHPYPIVAPPYLAVGSKYYIFSYIYPFLTSGAVDAPTSYLDYKFDGKVPLIKFVYQELGYYKWNGTYSSDFDECRNWWMVSPSGEASPQSFSECKDNFPRSGMPFVLDSQYAGIETEKDVLHGWACKQGEVWTICYNDLVKNHSLVLTDDINFPNNKFIIRPGAGIRRGNAGDIYDPANPPLPGIEWKSGSSATLVFAGVQVEGTWQKAPDPSSAVFYLLTTLGDLTVASTGSFDMTNVVLRDYGSFTLQQGSTFKNLNQNLEFRGSNPSQVIIQSKVLDIYRLSIQKDANISVLLQGDTGPQTYTDLTSETEYKRIRNVQVLSGVLDLNGYALNISSQLSTNGAGRVYLSYNSTINSPSRLTVMGLNLADTSPPLLLSNNDGVYSIDSDRGIILIGTGDPTLVPADPFAAGAHLVGPNAKVISDPSQGYNGLYSIRMSGGTFRVDNGLSTSGRELLISANGQFVLDRTKLQLDRSLNVNNPRTFTLAASPVFVGTTREQGDVVLANSDTSHPINLGKDADISLSGNFTDRVAYLTISGNGATVQMSGNNTTFRSVGNRFNQLVVSGNPVTYDTTTAGFGAATFLGGITVSPIESVMPRLVITAGSKVKLGAGAAVSIKGSLDAIGTAEKPITFTNSLEADDDATYYSVLVMGHVGNTGSFTGLLKARYVDFYYLGKDGLTIDEGAALSTNYSAIGLGDPNLDYNLAHCRFIRPDSKSASTALTFRNLQSLVIDGVRFISKYPAADASGVPSLSVGVINVRKTLKQDAAGNPSYIVFKNEICQTGDSLCADASLNSYDFSGEMFEDDQDSRIMWTTRAPFVKSATVGDFPLNSEWAQIKVNMYPNFNPLTTRYCIWAVKDTPGASDGYLRTNVRGLFDDKGTACELHTYAELNGDTGFGLNVDPLYMYKIYVKAPAQSFTFYYPETGYSLLSRSYVYNQSEALAICKDGSGAAMTCYMATDKLVPDRFPPAVPTAVTSTLALATPTSGLPYHFFNLNWGTVADPSMVDYVVMRGQGDAVGLRNLPTGLPAASYTPINGEYDSFDTDAKWTFSAAKSATVCSDPGSSCRAVIDGLLTMSGGGGAYVPVDGDVDLEDEADADTTIVAEIGGENAILKANVDYNFQNGYLLQLDVRRENGSARGIDILFPFRGIGAADVQARWSLGEISGGGINSILYTGVMNGGSIDVTVAQSKPIDALFSVGQFHQVLVYVKGRQARGFLDGREMWSLAMDQIPGDASYSFPQPVFALFVKRQTAVSIDNFLMMPFMVKDGAGVPQTVADTYAKDRSAPRTRVFTASNLEPTTGSSTSITMNLPLPGQETDDYNLNSGIGSGDRGTAYWYSVMAVDGAGNTSNLVQNRGFENTDGWVAGTVNYRNESTKVFEGLYYDEFTQEKTPSQKLNTVASPFAPGVLPNGSALRYSNFMRLDAANLNGGGIFYPTRMKVMYTVGASTATSFFMGSSIDKATNGWQPSSVLAYNPAYVTNAIGEIELQPAFDGLPTFSMYLDQARLDVLRGQQVAEGFKHTEIQWRTSGDDPCKTSGVWYSLGTPTTGTAVDTSGFTQGNTHRAYRIRSCDNLGNCGDWQGGVPCVGDTDCVGKSHTVAPFDKCVAFGDVSYCVRSQEGGSCVPGADIYTNAEVPKNPTISFITYSVAGREYVEENSLKFTWTANNRIGTQYIVALFKAITAAECGSGEPQFVLGDGTPRPDPLAESDAMLWFDQSKPRVAKNLDANRFHCFRVMARNGDKKTTGDMMGANNWAGWSPLSPAKLPPSIPQIKADSFQLKYGTNKDGSMRAIRVGSDMMQELTFVVTDQNNIGKVGTLNYHNSLDTIMVRIAPHAEWDEGAGTAFKRGFFVAKRNNDGVTWTISQSNPTGYGNPLVFLDTEGSSVVQVTNSDVEYLVTFRWKLRDAGTEVYDSIQDQGVAIAVIDEDNVSTPWEDNMHTGCNEVFHTSYAPEAPTLTVPGDPNVEGGYVWTNKANVTFHAWSPLDRDRERLKNPTDFSSDLFGKSCSVIMRNGSDVCGSWNLSQKYNCVDQGEASVGDRVYYTFEMCKRIDSNGLCTDPSDRYLRLPTQEVTTTQQVIQQIGGKAYLKTVYLYDITTAVPDEGLYYWHLYLRDQHTYEALGATRKADPAYYEVVPTTANTLTVGIDRTKPKFPDVNALTVMAIPPLPETVPVDITAKSGMWQRANRPTFNFSIADQDPTNLGLDKTAPIVTYATLLTNVTSAGVSLPITAYAPYRDVNGDGVAELVEGARILTNPTSGQTHLSDAYDDANKTRPGEYWWCAQAVDAAGNISDPLCYNLKIDRPELIAPIIESPTHPVETNVYTIEDHLPGVVIYEPQFNITDPTTEQIPSLGIDNPAKYAEKVPSDCAPVGNPNCRLSFSKIIAYDFTLSRTRDAEPTTPPEDTSAAGMITSCDPAAVAAGTCQVICESSGVCVDTDETKREPNNRNNQFAFKFVPASEFNNIFHKLVYQMYYKSSVLVGQTGTFYFKIKGWAESGSATEVGYFRVNVGVCDKECGSPKRLVRDNLTPMSFFAGSAAGSSSGSGQASAERVLPFYLDRTEVSNAAYADCVADGGCAAPGQAALASQTRQNYYGNPDYADYPMINVNWDQAQAYCQWLGKRLPSDKEWRFAAATVDSSAKVRRLKAADTLPVAESSLAQGLTTTTAPQHMLDNVSEWLGDWWIPEEALTSMEVEAEDVTPLMCMAYLDEKGMGQKLAAEEKQALCSRKVARGGSFLSGESLSAERLQLAPAKQLTNVGFRCAKDVQGTSALRIDVQPSSRLDLDANTFTLRAP